MNVTTALLEKIYRTIFYAAVIGLIAALFLPWVMIYIFDDIIFMNQITMYQEQTMDRGLNYISLLITISSVGFWGAIVFSIGGFIGLAYRKMEEIIHSYYFMVGSIPLLCFSVVALVPNILIWKELLSYDFFCRHSFNFIPLIMSVVMVVSSSLLVVLVGKRSIQGIMDHRRQKKDSTTYEMKSEEHAIDDEEIPEEIPEEEYSEEDHTCPGCGIYLEGKELICPGCRENISRRCPSCKKLISSFAKRCPRCGFIEESK